MNRFKNPNALMRIGMLFFLLANFWHWFVHPTSLLPDGPYDGILGLFYGIAISCMLMSVARRSGRRRSCDET